MVTSNVLYNKYLFYRSHESVKLLIVAGFCKCNFSLTFSDFGVTIKGFQMNDPSPKNP